jgi:hypothetical protein
MDLTTHKMRFIAVTSYTLTLGQAGGTGLLHLGMFQLVEEATQHVSKVHNKFAASWVAELVYGHSCCYYKSYCLMS